MINADSLRSSGKNYSNQIPHNNGNTRLIVFMNLFSPNSSPVNRDQRLDVLFGTVVEKKIHDRGPTSLKNACSNPWSILHQSQSHQSVLKYWNC